MKKTFNRNRIKMSFKTMKNMDQVIGSQNQKVQNVSDHLVEEQPELFCNCQPCKKEDHRTRQRNITYGRKMYKNLTDIRNYIDYRKYFFGLANLRRTLSINGQIVR